MTVTGYRIAGLVVSVLVIAFTGRRLTAAGSPYGSGLITLHKFGMLAAVALLVVIVRQAGRAAGFSTPEWAIFALTGLLIVVNVASGALLSTNNPMPAIVLRLHRLAPWFTGVGAAASAYLAVVRPA